VSPYTVVSELGHTDLKMITKTYGHLQRRRVRAAAVAYVEESKSKATD